MSEPSSTPRPDPTSSETTDEALLERYLDGDTASFRELIARYEPDLLRFLHRFLGDRQAAEDVFQDTFLQVHISGRTFDRSRRFRPWIFTIAANKARDLLRRKSRRHTLELSAPAGRDGDRGVSFVDLMEIDVPQPSSRLDTEERDALVQRALDGLSPVLREVLLLAYFQRLSYVQIAEDLGIPLGTVKSRLHAAVAKFAANWKALNETRTTSPQSKNDPDS